jgi:multidrug efflux system membrane fusion protein
MRKTTMRVRTGKTRQKSPWATTGAFALLTLGVLASGAGATACAKKSAADAPAPKAGGKAKLEYAVEVAPVALREVGYVVTAPGSIQAFEQVQVTSRVGGAVDKVAFSEGQTVKAGQVLAVIEVDRYQVAVDQAKATVDKASAMQAQASAQLARRQASNVEHPGLVAGEEVATYETSVATAKADVQAAKEAQRVAELNLRDAYVRAPMDGVIQTRTVETGQYLQPGTVLATLLQRDPLLLKFSVTAADAPRITPGMTVNMTLRESSRTYAAKITLVAGSADPSSHLVGVTAEVADKEHKYWLRPGVFCDVSIPVGATRQSAVVPEIAIRATERGFLAYVVEPAANGTTGVAKERSVQLGMHTANGFVEVTQGISAGDLLVVLGAEPLSDNAPVKIAQRTTMDTFDAGVAPVPPPTEVSAEASKWDGGHAH